MRDIPTGSGPPPSASRAAPLPPFDLPFVLSIAAWAALSTLLLLFVTLFGQNVPYHDDVHFVEALGGHEPVTIDWFWRLHNEHRAPLARLILLGSSWLFGYDLRPGFFITAVMLCSASLLVLLTLFRVRGCGAWFDVVLSLHGVSLLHYWNLFEGLNLNFSLYVLVSAGIVAAILRNAWNSFAGALGLGSMVLLLSTTGAYGLASSLVFLPGLVILAISIRGEHGSTHAPRSLVLGLSALLTGVHALFYLLAIRQIPAEAAKADLSILEFIRNGYRAVAMAWGGHLPPIFHPRSGWGSFLPISLLLSSAIAVGGWRLFEVARDRRRTAGLLLFFFSGIAVAAAIAFGRSESRWMGTWYVTMLTPLPWGLYLIGATDRRAGVRGVMGAILALLGAYAAIGGTSEAWRQGVRRRAATERQIHDARTGVPPSELASMHLIDGWSLMSRKAEIYESMHRLGIGPFDDSRPWLLEPPRFPEGQAWDLSRVDPVAWSPASEGEAVALRLGGEIVLRCPSGAEAFALVSPRNAPSNAGLIRITLASSVETIARLRIAPDLVASAPVRRGTNALTFLLPDPASGFVPLFSPGELPGNYRVLSIWTYPFPVAPSAFPWPSTPSFAPNGPDE